jgi:hypothetical protein
MEGLERGGGVTATTTMHSNYINIKNYITCLFLLILQLELCHGSHTTAY